MKKSLHYFFLLLMLGTNFHRTSAQCSTSNGGGCMCPDSSQNCLLLPDIIVSKTAVTAPGGWLEYAQNSGTPFSGQLLVTGATPNIGFGPLHVVSTDTFFCANDTIVSSNPPMYCPDGKHLRRLIKQKIYRKDSSTISTNEVTSGIMIHHGGTGHNHFHVEDWLHVSLRIKDSLESDPRKWPIVGETSKISFCLADYSACTQTNGYCRDSTEKILYSANIPNYGLAANYNSCTLEQGISPGYMDIYDAYTPGMNINIPYGTCNGEYWLVEEVDPLNYIVESNENNNLILVPITLSQQGTTPYASVVSSKGNTLCPEQDTLTLEASPGISFLWSTGDTTRKISVNKPGNYAVTVTTLCGTASSDSFFVKKITPSSLDSTFGDTLCGPGIATLSAFGTDSIFWINSNDSIVFKGNVFSVPATGSDTYFVASAKTTIPDTFYTGKKNNSAGGNFNSTTDHIRFNTYTPIIIKSVKVYADSARFRTFSLQNSISEELNVNAFFVPAGESRVPLNFPVPAGYNFRLICQNPYLWRDTSFNFPYSVPNVIELIGTWLDTNYPYAYDWEIISAAACSTVLSNKTAVQIFFGGTDSLSISGLDTAYFDTDPAAILSGFPPGGFFYGPGISGNTFDPALSGIGNKIITYVYTDSLGCSDSIQKNVNVKVVDAVEEQNSREALHIYPNPSGGAFTLSMPEGKLVQLRVLDAMGNEVRSISCTGTKKIDLSDCPTGVYWIHALTDTSSRYFNIIVKQ